MTVGKFVLGLVSGGVTAGILSASGAIDYIKKADSYQTTPSVKWDFNWDKREPSSFIKPSKNSSPDDDNKYNETLEELKPKATRHLFLIRHGQYITNGNEDRDKILTELGKKQAFKTGERLKDLGFSYTRIVQSSMTRARQTSEIICKLFPDVPVEECDLLREGAPIRPEPPSGHWMPDVHFFKDGARIEAAFRKYFHRAPASQKEDSFEIVVCHANVIRYFVCRALQLPPEAWLRFMLFHASITSVTIRPSGRVIVYGIGDSGHIPAEELTVS